MRPLSVCTTAVAVSSPNHQHHFQKTHHDRFGSRHTATVFVLARGLFTRERLMPRKLTHDDFLMSRQVIMTTDENVPQIADVSKTATATGDMAEAKSINELLLKIESLVHRWVSNLVYNFPFCRRWRSN